MPCQFNSSKFMPLYVLTMMASEEPMVEVPIVFASASVGALNNFAIIETHPVYSANAANVDSIVLYERFWISALTGYSS
jgi:hypothetical protein